MLKIINNIDLKDLENFGFYSYKINRTQTNYYRCFPYGAKIIIINNINREIVIDKWHEDDTRIHKYPKCHYKDKTYYADCLYDLIQAGIVTRE